MTTIAALHQQPPAPSRTFRFSAYFPGCEFDLIVLGSLFNAVLTRWSAGKPLNEQQQQFSAAWRTFLAKMVRAYTNDLHTAVHVFPAANVADAASANVHANVRTFDLQLSPLAASLVEDEMRNPVYQFDTSEPPSVFTLTGSLINFD